MDKPFTQERTHLYPEKAGLPGFRELVCVNFHQAFPPLTDHIHPDAIELCYVTKGSQVYAADGRRYRISAGMVYVTYANEVHSTDAMQQEKDVQLYYMIIDTVNRQERFLGLTGSDGPAMASQLNRLNRCFYVGNSLKSRLDEMLRLLQEQPPQYALLMRSHACLMIDELARASRNMQPALSQDICDTLQYIEDTLHGTPPDIAELAARIHLSVPGFKQKFRRQIGLPPIAYQMKRRIELACDLLSDGWSATRIAFELGFASSQHFSTTFRRHMGVSPREWARK